MSLFTEQEIGRRLGKAIRKRRSELGLSQEKVALRAGIDRRHFQELEYGFSNARLRSPANPCLVTLISLADALELELSDFVLLMEE